MDGRLDGQGPCCRGRPNQLRCPSRSAGKSRPALVTLPAKTPRASEALLQIRSVALATAEWTQSSEVERAAHAVEQSDHLVPAAEQTVHQLDALATELDSTVARLRV